MSLRPTAWTGVERGNSKKGIQKKGGSDPASQQLDRLINSTHSNIYSISTGKDTNNSTLEDTHNDKSIPTSPDP